MLQFPKPTLFGEKEGGVLVFSTFRFFKGMLAAVMVALLAVDEAELLEAVIVVILVEQW